MFLCIWSRADHRDTARGFAGNLNAPTGSIPTKRLKNTGARSKVPYQEHIQNNSCKATSIVY